MGPGTGTDTGWPGAEVGPCGWELTHEWVPWPDRRIGPATEDCGATLGDGWVAPTEVT